MLCNEASYLLTRLTVPAFYSAATLLAMQSAVLATAIPSACLSHAGTLSRRMKIGSCVFNGRTIKGFPFNISATAEASDFKFCRQLGFAKTHHKIRPEEKVEVALG